MKILQIIPYYNPAWAFGGPPRVMFDYALGLRKLGHDVSVFTTDAFQAKKRMTSNRSQINGIKIYYFRNVSNKLAWKRRFLPMGFRSALNQHINKFDILHLVDTRTYLNAIAWKIAKKVNIPYVVSVFGSLPRRKEGVKTIFDALHTRPMIQNAAALLAQTDHEKRVYQEFGARDEQLELVLLPINMLDFQNFPKRNFFRKKYNIDLNEKIILFLGRIHKYKGVGLLVKAFNNLLKKNKNIKLVIVGRDDGGHLQEVINLVNKFKIKDKVLLTGPLYNKNRIPAYIDADIFCLPACNFEETATASLEAAACCTPIIVTKQASVPWLEQYKAGFHVDYDQQQFEEKINFLINNDSQRLRYGQNAARLIREKFTINNVCKKLEKIYEKCI